MIGKQTQGPPLLANAYRFLAEVLMRIGFWRRLAKLPEAVAAHLNKSRVDGRTARTEDVETHCHSMH